MFGAAGRISRRWLLSTLGVAALFVGLVGGGASAAVSPTDGTDPGSTATASVVVDGTVPSTPTGLTTTLTSASVKLDWARNGGSAVTGYRVYRGTAPGKEASTPIATVTGTTFKDTAGTRNTTYYYIVKAVNAVGESPPSNEANATAN